MKIKLALVAALTICTIYSANAAPQEVTGLKSVIVASKASGVCTAYGSLMSFQLENKLEGGDVFVKEFITKMIDRTGMTAKQFFASCTDADNFIEKIKKSPDY